eukprot:CAMPEP_0113306048 /NCGR_PEP_ID=MMETSP0010_2-20120614/5451_1 /TAXON_ID=216773 ORGANISM="Corethron hystrix, Strain 308" /NCGR_SAMPLE_ID=MMETSP0010_2 /ASSEMBLY_ACC=CAM_ASM_000155 /LENGTH=319 /DNA_ID=CAMNT_0000160629 /DNA_START=469 /DNA_END=1428 /DNA_ORIENTATION=- /assembly_acc=CAM_ASM_000155
MSHEPSPAPFEMSDDEKYLFDLNGYIVLRGVFSPEEVADANAVIDRHLEEANSRLDPALRNTKNDSPMRGDNAKARMDLGGILEWGEDSKIFKKILAHDRLMPYLTTMLGKGFRMDHMPFIIAQDKGAEGFHLHGGTIDCESGAYNPFLAYNFINGHMQCSLVGCSLLLTDHNPGDGGFCVVKGSHKSNYKAPIDMVHGKAHTEYVEQLNTKAGDVILFSEGTVHGALPWMGEKQRRLALFRFAPAFMAYGRSYMASEDKTWPTAMYDDLTDAQSAILEPPYANRLDRPNIEEDGSVIITSRNQKKKEWDRKVFGTKYF